MKWEDIMGIYGYTIDIYIYIQMYNYVLYSIVIWDIAL